MRANATKFLAKLTCLFLRTGGLIIGEITRKWGTKAGIIFSMSGTAITLIGCAFAPDLWSLLALRFVGGLTGTRLSFSLAFVGFMVWQATQSLVL